MKYLQFDFYLALFVFCSSIFFAGCNSGPELPSDLPKLTPCSLSITQDGKPLGGASVTLISIGESQSWYPGGITDEAGQVELYTNGRYKGVPAGKYKILVNKTETDPSKLGPAPDMDDPKYGEWMEKSSKEKRDSYYLVEKQYNDAKTSPLEIEIPGGATTFDVGKAVKIKM